jgi:hypothetical protein
MAINTSASIQNRRHRTRICLLSATRPAHTAPDTCRIPAKFMPGASYPIGYPGTHFQSLLSLYANAAIKTKTQAADIRVVIHCFLHRQSAHKKKKKRKKTMPVTPFYSRANRCVDTIRNAFTFSLPRPAVANLIHLEGQI